MILIFLSKRSWSYPSMIISYHAHSHSQRPPSFATDEACPPFSPFGCCDQTGWNMAAFFMSQVAPLANKRRASGSHGVLVYLSLDCFVLDKCMQVQADKMNLVCFVRLLCVKTDSMHDFTLNKWLGGMSGSIHSCLAPGVRQWARSRSLTWKKYWAH